MQACLPGRMKEEEGCLGWGWRGALRVWRGACRCPWSPREMFGSEQDLRAPFPALDRVLAERTMAGLILRAGNPGAPPGMWLLHGPALWPGPQFPHL